MDVLRFVDNEVMECEGVIIEIKCLKIFFDFMLNKINWSDGF